MNILAVTVILVAAQSCWGTSDTDPYLIPDSFIQRSSEGTVVLNESVLGMPLWPAGVPDKATQATFRNFRVMDNKSHGMELFEGSHPHLSLCLITANGGTGITMHEKVGRWITPCKPVIEDCVIVQNGDQGLVGGQPVVSNSIVQ